MSYTGRGGHHLGMPSEYQSDTHRRLMREWHGLLPQDTWPSTGDECPAAMCPSWTADKRCRARETCGCPTADPCPKSEHEGKPYMHPRYKAKHRPQCVCQILQAAGLQYDHTHIWRREGSREKAWTTEPYNASQDVLDPATVRLGLAEYELTLTALGEDRSPWYPGMTTLYMITKA